MSIYKNLDKMKQIAKQYSYEHQCIYTIILMHPDEAGNPTQDSTYEFVGDSYFEKERPFTKKICTTDEY